MRKTLKAHEEKEATVKDDKKKEDGAVPAYLLDRNEVNRTKVLSNMIKQKRKEIQQLFSNKKRQRLLN